MGVSFGPHSPFLVVANVAVVIPVAFDCGGVSSVRIDVLLFTHILLVGRFVPFVLNDE